MSNGMSTEQFKETWQVILNICRTAQLVEVEDVQKLLETVDRAESIMPILDPTAYRDGAKNLDEQAVIARAFLAFRKVIETAKDKRTDEIRRAVQHLIDEELT